MTIIQAVILGIVQGLTEFLPVSSSAHLVIVPFLLNWKLEPAQAFVFDVLVQLGTLVAVILYFRKDLLDIAKSMIEGIKQRAPLRESKSQLGWMIILATIPAGLAGVLLKSKVEEAFNSIVFTAVMLFVTAVLLTLAEVFSRKQRDTSDVKPKDALIIGLFQVVSIFPGISRSGATISGGMLQGLKRQDAARFSFLMSIPIMLAAGLLAFIDMIKLPGLVSFLPTMAAGFVIAMVVGYFSIRWLLRYLKQKSLFPFAVYCAVLAIALVFFVYAH